ncbi:MAG: methionyl-tRNA formyltransferase [Candidatus Omnitrophica bacterium]|jgi:methionyl-tRNA formyltransferase|nr:methionyl-tRNA formyltransferase [Candidatus Omnitrophota bacterium]
MNIIYFGSSKFSLTILENLCLSGFKPKLVISQPDKPKGRGLKEKPTAISLFAQKANIPVITPQSIKTNEIKEQLSKMSPDLFIIADYGKILPASLLVIPKIAALGVHPSLLPLYRGPAPINWALLKGDKETGATIFKMNEGLDTGDIILQNKITISDKDNARTLSEKLAKEGARLLVESLNMLKRDSWATISQNEAFSSFAPKLQKKDGKINWQDNAIDIHNKIRGLAGWPSAYAFYRGKAIKITESEVLASETKIQPATIEIIKKDGIYVSTGNGTLNIKRLIPEGKSEMDAYSFVLGHRLKSGDKFE